MSLSVLPFTRINGDDRNICIFEASITKEDTINLNDAQEGVVNIYLVQSMDTNSRRWGINGMMINVD